MKIKYAIYAVIGLFVGYSILFGDDDSGAANVEYEEVVEPTEGLITTVLETEEDIFKIEDEEVVPLPEDSRIIAKYMDNTVDTFTLEEAKLVDAENGTGRRSGIFRAASYGLFGYMMGRRMGGSRPPASAYTDPKTAQRVNNNAGNKIANSAKRTTRAKPGKGGFGGGKSTRSVGG